MREVRIKNKKPPEGGSQFETDDRGSRSHQRWLGLPPISHETNASEAKDHHCPCGGFGDGGYGSIQYEAGHEMEVSIIATEYPTVYCGVIDVERVIEADENAMHDAAVRVSAYLPGAGDVDEYMIVSDPTREGQQVLQLNVIVARDVDHDEVVDRAVDRQGAA